jgi:prevent-host-death family protein
MASVTVRDLRNHGGEVLDRVARGEVLTVTRDGAKVAELSPKRRHGASARQLIERRRHLPDVDPDVLRHDLDDIVDAGW